jgi:hypothetical protein
MRVMVFVKATEDSEKGILPSAELFEARRPQFRGHNTYLLADPDSPRFCCLNYPAEADFL